MKILGSLISKYTSLSYGEREIREKMNVVCYCGDVKPKELQPSNNV